MLEVVGTALKGTTAAERKRLEDQRQAEQEVVERRAEEAGRRANLLRGTWHDPRLDCVAGNGIMSELGLGDELMRPEDYEIVGVTQDETSKASGENSAPTREFTPSEVMQLKTLPIVVIKNYATKRGHDEIMRVISSWAASLVNNQVRVQANHVIGMGIDKRCIDCTCYCLL